MSETRPDQAPAPEGGAFLLPDVAAMSDTQRQEELTKLQRDPAFFAIFKDRLHPQYPDAKRVFEQLHEPAAPMTAPQLPSQPLDLSRPFDVSQLPDDRKREIIRAMQAKMPPAMMDRFHPDKAAWSKMWDDLHVQGQGDAAGTGDADAGERIDLSHAAMVTGNMVAFTAARDDGRPLSLDDMAAAREVVASSMVTLGATQSDASWLAATLNGAISRAKEGISREQGIQRLSQQHGAAAQQTISDAAAVLMHLEEAGIPALEGLTRLGVANDPDLIAQLAKFAKRLPTLKVSPAAGLARSWRR